jgi:hypothetical protein
MDMVLLPRYLDTIGDLQEPEDRRGACPRVLNNDYSGC